jgi:anti-anti-sigma factor
MNNQMELRFQVECQQDVAVVRCSGRLVRGVALERLRRRIEQLENARILVVDLSEVEQLDAGGLGTLLLIRGWARRHSVQMKLVNPSLFILRVLEATRLTSVFEISSLEEALSILEARGDWPPHYAVA